MSEDANFHLVGLAKRNNRAEEALWAGHGYIRKQEDLEEHLVRHQPVMMEEVHCISSNPVPPDSFSLPEVYMLQFPCHRESKHLEAPRSERERSGNAAL